MRTLPAIFLLFVSVSSYAWRPYNSRHGVSESNFRSCPVSSSFASKHAWPSDVEVFTPNQSMRKDITKQQAERNSDGLVSITEDGQGLAYYGISFNTDQYSEKRSYFVSEYNEYYKVRGNADCSQRLVEIGYDGTRVFTYKSGAIESYRIKSGEIVTAEEAKDFVYSLKSESQHLCDILNKTAKGQSKIEVIDNTSKNSLFTKDDWKGQYYTYSASARCYLND